MKKIISLVLCLSFISLQASAIILPEGKAIPVKPVQDLNADNLKQGETVIFEVAQPVKVNGNVVVKQGTEVTAQVAKLKNNFILGIPGEMELTNFQLITNDNDSILLRGNIRDKGEGRYWAHVGWFFLFPLLFVKGGDGKIPATVQYTMYTMEEVNL